MAIDSNATPVTPPSKTRVKAVVIYPGDQEVVDGVPKFSKPTYAEVVIQGCEPALDTDGNQLTNVYGQPVWLDQEGWTASGRITDQEVLAGYLELFGQIMTIAEEFAVNIPMTGKK